MIRHIYPNVALYAAYDQRRVRLRQTGMLIPFSLTHHPYFQKLYLPLLDFKKFRKNIYDESDYKEYRFR